MAESDKSRQNARPAARVSAARLALAVRKLREEKENLDLIGSDPIAIIGMGCRFPGGADSPEKLWAALVEGRDCVGEIPAGRWVDAGMLPDHMRRGGYIEEIEGFDAGYFGISPREALNIDPQQRLLMEVAWEALWDAGIEPASLAGTDTGVFVAIYNSDYARLHFRDMSQLTAHAGTGAVHSVAAGRISFLLNTRGPSLALDSACSSSLVAIHLACQSLRTRECGLAIAAASSLKLLSDEVLLFSKWGMLASDGRCKTFDAAADGFVPGEGSGIVVLKRLSDALQDGDRIRAVIRGTAVNHDGRSTVLTAPNGLAHEAVLRAALRNAMLEPGEITFIETHGTGTSLGDPIEMEAIVNVYRVTGGDGGEAPPCMLGAVKTNLGHLEASAGMAGLIKTVLCLEQGAIPKNLHFKKLNPEISLAGSRFRIATENTSWSRGSQPRVAGISSFGLGGTNSHIIVEEAPILPARSSEKRTIPLVARRWQRQHFPFAPPAIAKIERPAAMSTKDLVHPLLGRRVDSPFVQGALFESDLNTGAVPYLNEHRLGDRALVPFAAFLEIAAAAGREIQKTTPAGICIGLRNFAMCEPRFLSAVSCRMQVLAGESSVEIAGENESGWRTNAKGSFESAAIAAENVDLAALRARCRQPISVEDLYRRLEKTGLHYGAPFRTIQSAWSGPEGAGEELVHLQMPDHLRAEAARYGIHPTLLDGCLQAVAIVSGEKDDELFLPIGIDSFELHRTGASELWAHAKIVSSSNEAISVDLTIADAAGAVVARLIGFTAKRTNVQQVGALINSSSSALTYEIAWRALPLNMQSTIKADGRIQAGARWLLVESEPGNCSSLEKSLRARGVVCERIRAAEFLASANNLAYAGVVFDARGISAACDSEWEHLEKQAVEFVLNFVRSLTNAKAVPRLWVVSSFAMAVLPGEDVAIAQTPLLGLVRTLALEYPETAATLLDVGPSNADVETMLAEEISSDGIEPLVAFRNGTRYGTRIAHLEPAEHRRLQIASSGRLEDLRLESVTRRDPEPHEVEIEVRAAGLNFRDVLTALGMLAARSATPGAECSGTIVRVGTAVRGWKLGEDVLAFAPGSLQFFVNVPADFVVRKPTAMTFAEAAGIPIAFLTAHYGLTRLAKLSAEQTILIHAAAGGLGLAAVQLAMRVGATVFATAGSPEKRAFLKRLGVEHVFDSRSLAFREQILEATGGAGVDVVLNSLSGDFIRASFDVIAREGCFLEVGKRGIWSDAEVTALGKNIRYFPFDMGDVAMENPSQIGAMLRELMARFANGELQPLPTAIYDFGNATDAFRTMAQARHIGKIVLGVDARPPQATTRELISGGAALILGGLGALGLETARWLAAQGASKIILAGRSAQPDEPHAVIAELRAQGVEIAMERVDVASFDQMQQLFNRIRAAGTRLQVVFHAAGVVQDSVLQKESWSSYCEATAAKIEGAWNLHRLTENDPVPLMVFFSSAASIFGSPGQGSYAAGNAFLDALAQHRAARGLRTLSVNWGAWASAGMAARLSPELTARSARQGSRPMAAAAALGALESAMESGSSQVAILDVDWQRFLSERPLRRDAALFAELDRKSIGEQQRGVAERVEAEAGILERIRATAPLDRKIILSAHVKMCARHVLGLDENAAIQDDVPLQDMGLDSLMALEMRNELAQSLAIPLAAGLLFDYPSVDTLTQHLLGLLDVRDDVEDHSAEAVHGLSEEEAERLLIEELDRAEREKANV